MDIEKIIDDATKSAIKLMTENKNPEHPQLSDKIEGLVAINTHLMRFSTELIRRYHEELKTELLKRGIEI